MVKLCQRSISIQPKKKESKISQACEITCQHVSSGTDNNYENSCSVNVSWKTHLSVSYGKSSLGLFP